MFRSFFARIDFGVTSFVATAALGGVLVFSSWGCGSSNSQSTDEQPDASTEASTCNGFVDENGDCVPKCHNDQCKAGNICVNNTCVLQCSSHKDCPMGYECTPAKADEDGSDTSVCTPVSYPHGDGEFFTPCPNGDECNEDAGFVCIGAKDDPDAFCTKWDCKSDDDCPSSMYCGVGRVFREICDDPDFKIIIDPTDDCINSSDMTADGHTFRKGPISLLRNICLPRSYCAPCESDLDCSASRFSKCIKDGDKPGYCSRPCDKGLYDCPWQGASQCGSVDGAQGDVCKPTSGACTGDRSACSMCRNDLDCWQPGDKNRKACLRGTMSNEPYCIDFDFECNKNEDCPESPGGVRMQCLNNPAYKESLLYKRCYPADNGVLSQGQPSCYPNPRLKH